MFTLTAFNPESRFRVNHLGRMQISGSHINHRYPNGAHTHHVLNRMTIGLILRGGWAGLVNTTVMKGVCSFQAMCIIKQISIRLFSEIPSHSTDGHGGGRYFLCPGIPYPKKTNMMEIWSPRISSHCPALLLRTFALPALFQLVSLVKLTANDVLEWWKCSVSYYLWIGEIEQVVLCWKDFIHNATQCTISLFTRTCQSVHLHCRHLCRFYLYANESWFACGSYHFYFILFVKP